MCNKIPDLSRILLHALNVQLFYQVFYYIFKVCNFILINFICKRLGGYNL
jgi:hypothetical protein